MYNFKLLNGEEIRKIIDDVLVYPDNKLCTFIITSVRLLVLDYPSSFHNSMEDLRISGKVNYVRMKEIIFECQNNAIKSVIKNKNKYIIKILDHSFIETDNRDVYEELKKVIKWKK